MPLVVGPEVDLAERHTVVGIRIGDAGLKRAIPRFAHGDDPADNRRGGRSPVIGGANVFGHLFDGLAVPVAFRRVNLIGARPSRDQANVDRRVFAVEQLRELLGRADEEVGVAGLSGVEQALALHHHAVPSAADQVEFLREMKVEAGTADRL